MTSCLARRLKKNGVTEMSIWIHYLEIAFHLALIACILLRASGVVD
jgi:hypothetical protein